MKYKIIYCDPAWDFETWSEKGKDRSPKYSTSSIDAFKQMEISWISEDNSVIFMWATYPFLDQAIDLMKHWGFTYKTVAFTWVKLNKKWKETFVKYASPQIRYPSLTSLANKLAEFIHWIGKGGLWHMGGGYHTRANPEVVLLGVKGDGLERIDMGVRNLVISPVGEHSVKPDEVRERIEKLYGEHSRVELFATKKTSGWDSVGYDIGISIEDFIKQNGD